MLSPVLAEGHVHSGHSFRTNQLKAVYLQTLPERSKVISVAVNDTVIGNLRNEQNRVFASNQQRISRLACIRVTVLRRLVGKDKRETNHSRPVFTVLQEDCLALTGHTYR